MRRKKIVIVLIALLIWTQFIPAALITADEVSQQSEIVEASDSAVISEEEEKSDTEVAKDEVSGEEQNETKDRDSQEEATESAETSQEPESEPDLEPEQSDIKTGDATASATFQNEINTNIVGENNLTSVVSVDENSEDEDIDLSQYQIQCPVQYKFLSTDHTSEEVIEVINKARLENNISANADTGHNKSEGGSIETGDATSQVNQFNLVNTNLIGDCWYFGIFNFFTEYSGDVILPYEGSIAGDNSGKHQSTATKSSEVSDKVKVNNEAELKSDLETDANTGDNELEGSGEIDTGSASTKIQTIDKINTNIYGSNWLLIEILNPKYWQGTFEGIEPQFFSTDSSLFFWMPPENDTSGTAPSTFKQDKTIKITNTAEVENNISANSNTGGNSAKGQDSSIKTGDAISKINLINYINTNIIGDHWYYTAFNLFEPFTGSIIFPRADLISFLKADKKQVQPGEMVLVTLNFANRGRIIAIDSTAEMSIPEGLAIVDSSPGGVISGGKISWQLGNMSPGQKGYRQVMLQANSNLDQPISVALTGKVGTDTKEGSQSNNNSSISLDLLIPQALGGIANHEEKYETVVGEETENVAGMQPEAVVVHTNTINPLLSGLPNVITGQVLAMENTQDDLDRSTMPQSIGMCQNPQFSQETGYTIWQSILEFIQQFFPGFYL